MQGSRTNERLGLHYRPAAPVASRSQPSRLATRRSGARTRRIVAGPVNASCVSRAARLDTPDLHEKNRDFLKDDERRDARPTSLSNAEPGAGIFRFFRKSRWASALLRVGTPSRDAGGLPATLAGIRGRGRRRPTGPAPAHATATPVSGWLRFRVQTGQRLTRRHTARSNRGRGVRPGSVTDL